MMDGYIYILSNPSFVKGRIKIGKTERDPEDYRRHELDTTGVPEPFKVEYWAYVKNYHELEKHLHKKFSDQRVRSNREFFTVDVSDVIIEIRSNGILKENINYEAEEILLLKSQLKTTEEYISSCQLMIEEEKRKIKESEISKINKLREEQIKKELRINGDPVGLRLFWGFIASLFILPSLTSSDKQLFICFCIAMIAAYFWGKHVKKKQNLAAIEHADKQHPINTIFIDNMAHQKTITFRERLARLNIQKKELEDLIKKTRIKNSSDSQKYKFFTCKNCKQNLRSLKDRDLIVICPKCKEEYHYNKIADKFIELNNENLTENSGLYLLNNSEVDLTIISDNSKNIDNDNDKRLKFLECQNCACLIKIDNERKIEITCENCNKQYYYNRILHSLIDFSNASAFFDRALIWSERGDSRHAIEDYNEAIRLNQDYAEAYYNRALIWSDKGDNEQALKDYHEAIRLNPSYADAYYNRALIWSDKGDNELALKDYHEAIRLNPAYADAYYNSSLFGLAKAIRLNPNYVDAYNYSGGAWTVKGEHNRASDDYEINSRLNSQSINTNNNRIENKNVNNKENFGIGKTSINHYRETEQYKNLSKLKKEILKEPLGKFGERAFEYRCGHCNSSSQHFYYEKKNVVRCQQCGFEIILE